MLAVLRAGGPMSLKKSWLATCGAGSARCLAATAPSAALPLTLSCTVKHTFSQRNMMMYLA